MAKRPKEMRLIDADHLRRWILSWWERTEPTLAYHKVINILDQIDREWSINIVQCKDCKYADKYARCKWVSWYNNKDDFCSRGERREDGTKD